MSDTKDELERANQRILGAERLLLRASRIIELDDWRDDYDAWMRSAGACPYCVERLSGHDPECPTLRAKRSPVLRPEFVALGEALGLARPTNEADEAWVNAEQQQGAMGPAAVPTGELSRVDELEHELLMVRSERDLLETQNAALSRRLYGGDREEDE